MKEPGPKPTQPHTAEARRFPHAMLREIFEQPQALRQTFEAHVNAPDIFPGAAAALESAISSFNKIIIAASGSSRHAGLAGEIVIEDLCGIPVDVEYASEYCYRSTHATAHPVVMVISQSGETADTLAALREARTRGANTIAVCNAADSTLVREASAALLTHAGRETAIPATKSFLTQLLVLYLFALFMARRRGRMATAAAMQQLRRLQLIPDLLERQIPLWEGATREIARQIHRA